jgi:hypothetical protein
MVTPAVLAAGSFLNPITAFTIRELTRRTGGKDRRRYQPTEPKTIRRFAALAKTSGIRLLTSSSLLD